MQKDVPLRAGNVNVMQDIPKINLTAGDFRKEYLNTFTNMAKDIYAIGNQFIAVDQKIEQNKEFNNVNNQLTEARAEYSKEYEDPEKIKLGDSEWREQRDSALKLLREKEFEIIRSSRIDNISKEKFSTTSNRYYTEKGVKNNMIYGEYTRQTNLSEATNNITNSIELISMTDNESEREQLINSVNNSRDILLKYGLPEAQVNSTILENIKKSLTIASKNDIDMLFDSNPPDVAYQKANELLGAGAQKYTALLGNVDGIKESKALDLMNGYYEEQKKTFGLYIKKTRDNIKKALETESRLKKEFYDREIEDALYKRDPYAILYIENGKKKKITMEEFLQDNGSALSKVTDYDLNDFGDPNKEIAFPFLTSAAIGSLNKEIAGKISSGQYSYQESYKPLYEFADSLSKGSLRKRNALIIDYALKNKIDPVVLLEGEKNGEYFRIANLMAKGNNVSNETNISNFAFTLKGKNLTNFNELAETFSSDKVLGQTLATKYLLGYARINNRDGKLLENPQLELGKLLNNQQMNIYRKDIKTASEFTSKRKDYHYVTLLDPREKNRTTHKKIEQDNNTIKKEKQSSLFGG